MPMTKADSCSIRNFYKFSKISDGNLLAKYSLLKILWGINEFILKCHIWANSVLSYFLINTYFYMSVGVILSWISLAHHHSLNGYDKSTEVAFRGAHTFSSLQTVYPAEDTHGPTSRDPAPEAMCVHLGTSLSAVHTCDLVTRTAHDFP